jgi:hypothetical protein
LANAEIVGRGGGEFPRPPKLRREYTLKADVEFFAKKYCRQ